MPLGGFFNGSPVISNVAASLRSDYLITDAWRLVAALRTDKFSYPDDTYLSYQLASTYKHSDKYLVRAAHSRSNSGSFLNNLVNIDYPVILSGVRVPGRINGNPDLELATVTMTEVGFRGQLTNHLQLDVEIFRQRIRNLFSIATTGATFGADAFPTYIQSNYVNLPLTAVQHGVTLSVNYIPEKRFQIRPFVTVQQTDVKDIPEAFVDLPISGLVPKNLSNTFDGQNESVPRFFGGAYVNTALTRRLNANLNAYFFGAHAQYGQLDLTDPERDTKVNDISSKLLINAKVSYRLVDQLKVYATAKNLLGNDSREHYGTDRIGRSFFGGVSYNF